MRKNISGLVTLLFLLAFVVYFVLNAGQFKPLLHVNIFLLLLIACADISTMAANGLFIKFIIEPMDKYISFAESVRVSVISSIGNFFAPAGSGFGFRAVYLKKKHGLSYGDFMATLYGNYLIIFMVNAAFALLSLYLLRNVAGRGYFVLLIVFGGMFVTSFLLSFIRLPSSSKDQLFKNRHLNRITKLLLEMVQGWNKIVSNRRLLAHLILIMAFNFLMSLAVAKLEITALHFSISFPSLLLFSVLGSLSLFINITPANFGVKEAIYLFSASVIGLSAPQILSIALIDRGVLFIVLLALWLYFFKYKHTPTTFKKLRD